MRSLAPKTLRANGPAEATALTAAPARPLLKSLRVISKSAIFLPTSISVLLATAPSVPPGGLDIFAQFAMQEGRKKDLTQRAQRERALSLRRRGRNEIPGSKIGRAHV